MKKSVWIATVTAAIALMGIAPRVAALQGDSITFKLAVSPGATCLATGARAQVTVSDLGPVQNMHIEMFGLPANISFTTFVTQHGDRPFGFSWYQGEIVTDKNGRGVADYTGIFSDETFLLGDSAVQMDHLGIWFADPNDAANAGCSDTVTPFDGDHVAGILVFSSANFPDNHGPLLQLGDPKPTANQ